MNMFLDAAFDAPEMNPALRSLFHQLNNQVGIILAYAELLEQKAEDEMSQARAAQVVTSVLDAMDTIKRLRQHAELSSGMALVTTPTPQAALSRV